MKTKNFSVEGIEICRNCKGTGVEEKPTGEKATIESLCHVCNGSGRVKILRQGTVTVEPYKGLNNESNHHHR